MGRYLLAVWALAAAACTQTPTATCADAAVIPDESVSADLAQPPQLDAGGTDGDAVQCASNGNPGQCMDATACTALPSWTAVPGLCPGLSSVQCCVLTPNIANNPPVPSGWVLLQQSMVTPAMTAWAVQILNSPGTYPIFSSTLRVFGSMTVMARVEWHPPDFQNSAVHRGVTLYHP